MKKLLLIFTAAVMLCTNAAVAQKSFDAESVKSKLEKSDAEIENAKKSLKASTWMNRGDLYFKSITEPSKILFVGLDQAIVASSCGNPKYGSTTVGNTKYSTWKYPFFTAYLVDKKVVAWTIDKMVHKDALNIAIKAYEKALELDPSLAPKIKAAFATMNDYYKQLGVVAITINNVNVAASAFESVCRIQANKAYNSVDPMMLFYAGYMMTRQGEKTPAAYVKGEAHLKRALEAGYQKLEDVNTDLNDKDRGNIYYYLYHCSYAQKAKNADKVATAKGYLTEGIEKYPMNESIFEGLLQIYTNEQNMGDPKELLGTIEKTIELNPNSINAWFARGRIYYALEDYDQSIESFKHVVALEPQSFDGNFYLGYFYMLKGDDMLDDMKEITYTDQSKYDSDLAELNKVYGSAIPYFEAAHVAKPTDESTLNYLKQLCFRLRDEPGVMEKYSKYNKLFSEL